MGEYKYIIKNATFSIILAVPRRWHTGYHALVASVVGVSKLEEKRKGSESRP